MNQTFVATSFSVFDVKVPDIYFDTSENNRRSSSSCFVNRGKKRINQIRRHFETNEPGNRVESKEERVRFLSPVDTDSSYSPSSSLSSLTSPSISFVSSEIFKVFLSYFPLFLLIVLLSQSPASISVYIFSSTASWIGLLFCLHPFQFPLANNNAFL